MMLSKSFYRVLSALLLVCMLMSLTPTAVFADDGVETAEEIAEALDYTEPADDTLPAESEIPEETAGQEETLIVEAAEPELPVEPELPAETESDADAPTAVETEIAAEAAEPELPADEPAAAPVPKSPAAEEYTLTYYSNDPDTGRATRKAHTAGETVRLTEVSFGRDVKLNKDGSYCAKYTLVGWNTQKSGGGTGYALSDTLTMPAQDLDLYGVWEESEQVYWAVSAEAGGSLRYQPMKVSPGSDEWITAAAGETVKVYVSGGRTVYAGTIHGFTPVADDGYVFDGW